MHSVYNLDPSYWKVQGNKLESSGIFSHSTDSYVLNPMVLNLLGFNKNSVLSPLQLRTFFNRFTPANSSVNNASSFSLASWYENGWGSNSVEILENYSAFITANAVSSVQVNPGQFPVTTLLVSGEIDGVEYFVPILVFAQQEGQQFVLSGHLTVAGSDTVTVPIGFVVKEYTVEFVSPEDPEFITCYPSAQDSIIGGLVLHNDVHNLILQWSVSGTRTIRWLAKG